MLTDEYAGPPVFFIDTESIRPSGSQPLILSITMLDAKGNTILNNATVDYGQRIGELCQGLPDASRTYAMRIYKVQSGASRTHGLKPQDLTKSLKELGLRRNSIIVEWSTSGWDWRALQRLYGDDDHLPATPTTAPRILREAGYQGSIALAVVFYYLFPYSPLCQVHHDSDIDTFKLYAVVFHLLSKGRPLPAVVAVHIGEDEQSRSLPDGFWGDPPEPQSPKELEDWEVESSEDDDDIGSDYMPSNSEKDE